MKVPRVARRTVAACLAIAAFAPAAAHAATQQEVTAGVAAGAAWLRTQQNTATGQITASAATTRCRRSPPPACMPPTCTARERSTRRAGLLRRPVVGSDDAELDGDPVRLRGGDRRAAAVSVDEPGRAARDGVQPHRRSRGLVRRRCDQPHGVQRARARSRGRAGGRARQGQRLPPRPAAHRRRLELRPRGHGRPARGSEQRRHDRRRARGAVRDGSGSDRRRTCAAASRSSKGARTRQPAGSGTSTRPAGRCPASTRAGSIRRAGG